MAKEKKDKIMKEKETEAPAETVEGKEAEISRKEKSSKKKQDSEKKQVLEEETDSEENQDADSEDADLEMIDLEGNDSGEADSEEPDPEETNSEEADSKEESTAADDGKESKKDGFFKKKKKDKRDEQIEELNDRLKRQMAEFDNFRKRTEKEKSQMFDLGARTIIEKILPVVDNFERGLAAVDESQKEDAFVSGMDKVYKQMMTELENIGVKAIEAVGEEFNPEYHNAVMQVESEEYESGVVAQELQKGYMYKDTVVRHSMVAVVQ